MQLVSRSSGVISLSFDSDEQHVVSELISQLIELLQSYSATPLEQDPLFAGLEVGGAECEPDDPALARLFPSAYSDEHDSRSFRQVTEQGLVTRKLDDAIAVSTALGASAALPAADGTVTVELDRAAVDQWLKTLTALRLALSARIGFFADGDQQRLREDADTRGTILVLEWLGAVLESLLTAIHS